MHQIFMQARVSSIPNGLMGVVIEEQNTIDLIRNVLNAALKARADRNSIYLQKDVKKESEGESK